MGYHKNRSLDLTLAYTAMRFSNYPNPAKKSLGTSMLNLQGFCFSEFKGIFYNGSNVEMNIIRIVLIIGLDLKLVTNRKSTILLLN